VRPLIRYWRVSEKEHAGRSFRFFENENVALVCGGIGTEAARRATEAIIALYAPSVVYSAGFAGALDAHMKVGDILEPRWVINASDGSRVDTGAGEGTLLTFGSVASPQQKAKLQDSFRALAVDMEAAAVARAAEVRGVRFAALKVISDEAGFVFPSMERFVDANGQFREVQFALFSALRPWLWPRVAQLARNSGRASRALCDGLRKIGSPARADHAGALEALHHP